MAAVAVHGPSRKAVFYHFYLENSFNNFVVNLSAPTGTWEQCINRYPSGGKAGGNATTTDGNLIWSFSANGGKPFVYRADGQPFGSCQAAYINGVHCPSGMVTGMANARTPNTTVVFIARQARHWLPGSNDGIDVLDGYSLQGNLLLS